MNFDPADDLVRPLSADLATVQPGLFLDAMMDTTGDSSGFDLPDPSQLFANAFGGRGPMSGISEGEFTLENVLATPMELASANTCGAHYMYIYVSDQILHGRIIWGRDGSLELK